MTAPVLPSQPSTDAVCMMCGKPEPVNGWYIVGCNDGDAEFFCSEECWEMNSYSPCDEDELT